VLVFTLQKIHSNGVFNILSLDLIWTECVYLTTAGSSRSFTIKLKSA
jgi:hypothetical protein